MKRIILFTLLFIALKAHAQNYTTPGVPSGTTSVSPTFRYKAVSPDSLNSIWFSIGTKWYRLPTFVQLNRSFDHNFLVTDSVHLANNLSIGSTINQFKIQQTVTSDTHAFLVNIRADSAGHPKDLQLDGSRITVNHGSLTYANEHHITTWSTNRFSIPDRYYNDSVYRPRDTTVFTVDTFVVWKNGLPYKQPYSGGGGTTTNPLTFSNAGSGDASGTIFNGALARTISWNSIGAQQALTLTTTGTSGAATLSGGALNIPQYSGATGANPTATAGATAVNGSATTFMRSDAAPKVDSTVFQTVANSYSLSGLQTKFNGYVPTSTTINGKALSSNITLGLASSDFVNQGTTTTILHGNASGNPSFSQIVNADITNSTIDLTNKVTGILPISNGGTGVSSITTTPTASAWVGQDANKNYSANAFLQGYTSTATASGTTILTVSSTQYQEFTGTLSQTVQLPAVSTMAIGQQFIIRNSSASNSNIVVNSSGGNAVVTLLQGQIARVTCISTSGTGAGSWQLDWNAFNSNSNGLNLNGGNLGANIGTFATVGATTFRGINATQAVLNGSVTVGGTYGFILNTGTSGGTISNSSLIAMPFAITQTYNQTGTAGSTDFTINRTETALGSGVHKFESFQVSGTEKYNVDHLGNVTAQTFIAKSNSLSAINSTATATAAQLATGVITSTSAAATTITLPTATLMATQINAAQGTTFEFTVDNTAGANTVTIALGAGMTQLTTITGASTLTIPSGTTGVGVFRLYFSSTTACTFSRIE